MNVLVCNPNPLQEPPKTSSKMNGRKGSCSAARKHGKCKTCGGGCACIGAGSDGNDGDGIHVDRCHGWDAWGHEAVVDKVGMWNVIGEYGGGVTAED